MTKIILIYGVVAGLIIIGVNTLNLEIGFGDAWLGFLVMFLAFSLIYVAIKQYRDQSLGGSVQFLRALWIGLAISFVASIVYVTIWELYSYITNYAYIDLYTDTRIEAAKLSTANEIEVSNAIAEANAFRQQYANPLFRLPMTFVEIFPVGFLVSVVSAALLRTKN